MDQVAAKDLTQAAFGVTMLGFQVGQRPPVGQLVRVTLPKPLFGKKTGKGRIISYNGNIANVQVGSATQVCVRDNIVRQFFSLICVVYLSKLSVTSLYCTRPRRRQKRCVELGLLYILDCSLSVSYILDCIRRQRRKIISKGAEGYRPRPRSRNTSWMANGGR